MVEYIIAGAVIVGFIVGAVLFLKNKGPASTGTGSGGGKPNDGPPTHTV